VATAITGASSKRSGCTGPDGPQTPLQTGQAIYALRKIIAEPVFAQIKGARGLDRSLLRGLKKVDGEWALMAITHNIGKLHRAALAAI